jgi:hypothetical protein
MLPFPNRKGNPYEDTFHPERPPYGTEHCHNATGQVEGDFEKGEADGSTASLALRTAALLES